MNKLQRLRLKMAERGIECTPDEVLKLTKIAKKLKSMGKLPDNELRAKFDVSDPKHKLIYDTIFNFRT